LLKQRIKHMLINIEQILIDTGPDIIEEYIPEELDFLPILIFQVKDINKGWSSKIFQLYFNLSYDNATILLKTNQQIPQFLKKLPLHNQNYLISIDEVIDKIQYEKEKFLDLFTKNTRIHALKNHNHYFSSFYYKNINDNQINFTTRDKKFEKAIASAYLFSIILQYVDNMTIKVLQEVIRNLKYLNNNDHNNLIKFYELCLILFKQKKYQKIYANLTISKTLDLTLSESMNYAKKTIDNISSIRKNTYQKKSIDFQVLCLEDFFHLL